MNINNTFSVILKKLKRVDDIFGSDIKTDFFEWLY